MLFPNKDRAAGMPRVLTLLCLFALLVFTAHPADAATYYLSPTGSDTSGDGSSGNPWKTLYKAGQAVPGRQGHIVHLKPGTYLLDKTVNPFGAYAAVWINPGITLEGENTTTDRTKTVILTHQDNSFPGFGINVSTGSFETSPGGMRNLTIDGDNFTGYGGASTLKISNFTVDNVSFQNLGGSGMRVAVTGDGTHIVGQETSGNEVKNSYFSKTKGYCVGGDGWMNSSVHDCYMDNSDIANPSLSNPSPWGDCVNVFYVGSTRIYNNTMYAPSYTSPFTSWQQQQTQDTICLFYSSGGNEIDHNELGQWVTLVGSTTLNGYDRIVKVHDNHIFFPYDVAGSAIELMCSDSDVYNNYIDNCEIGVLTDPGAVSAGNTASDITNVRVFNNVFRRTFSGALYEGYGIAFRNSTNTTARNWSIYNNVFDGFDRGFQMDGGGFVTSLNVKNNVFLNMGRIINWGYPTDPITNANFTNNIWHCTQGFDINPAPPAGANVVFANNLPGATASLAAASAAGLNLSGALPTPYYAPSSEAALPVNAGTASIAPGITLTGFSGSAPDIGVYEWTGGGGGSGNIAPTIATAASASPNLVTTGTTTTLTVVGADDGGEPALTYTWATTGTPPASVAFSPNGSNGAKNATATFSKAGTYALRVTVQDAGGLTATSNVTVTVQATPTTVTVTPASVTVNTGATQQFTAFVKDQFGLAVSGASVTWSVLAGTGSVNSSGLYTAPASAGSATVRAQSGSLSGTASVTITAPPPPQPPAAPGSLTATAGNAQVSLFWGSVSGATSYTVKRSTTSGGSYSTLQSGVTGITYTNTGLTNGTTYYYVVTAQNVNGSSGNSNPASATPVAPAAVTRYEAESGSLSGATSIATSRAGYSGTGFVSVGFLGGVTWNSVVPPAAGTRTLLIRYATTNAGTRSLTLWVNGVSVKQLQFTNSAGNWATLTETVTLNAGTNSIAIKGGYGDSAGLDLDCIDVQ